MRKEKRGSRKSHRAGVSVFLDESGR